MKTLGERPGTSSNCWHRAGQAPGAACRPGTRSSGWQRAGHAPGAPGNVQAMQCEHPFSFPAKYEHLDTAVATAVGPNCVKFYE